MLHACPLRVEHRSAHPTVGAVAHVGLALRPRVLVVLVEGVEGRRHRKRLGAIDADSNAERENPHADMPVTRRMRGAHANEPHERGPRRDDG